MHRAPPLLCVPRAPHAGRSATSAPPSLVNCRRGAHRRWSLRRGARATSLPPLRLSRLCRRRTHPCAQHWNCTPPPLPPAAPCRSAPVALVRTHPACPTTLGNPQAALARPAGSHLSGPFAPPVRANACWLQEARLPPIRMQTLHETLVLTHWHQGGGRALPAGSGCVAGCPARHGNVRAQVARGGLPRWTRADVWIMHASIALRCGRGGRGGTSRGQQGGALGASGDEPRGPHAQGSWLVVGAARRCRCSGCQGTWVAGQAEQG